VLLHQCLSAIEPVAAFVGADRHRAFGHVLQFGQVRLGGTSGAGSEQGSSGGRGEDRATAGQKAAI